MRYLISSIAALVLCGVASEAHAYKATVYGAGTVSCGKWLESSSDIDARHFYTSWLLGWVSAASHYDVRGELRDADTAAMSAWMDNYCHDHPLDGINVAADALVRAMAKQDKE